MVSTTPERSELMKRVRQSGTNTELSVRKLLSSIGAHYRLNVRGLPGTPDIVNKTRKKIIFVHGCFWHFHDGCKRSKIPNRNHSFWSQKLSENRRRDLDKQTQLEGHGYDVLVVWECELDNPDTLRSKLREFWLGGEHTRV